MNVPNGLVSLVQEGNVMDGEPGNEWFSATFIGMSPANRDNTLLRLETLEDRIIDFRTPILLTGYHIGKDEVFFSLGPFHLLGASSIIELCSLPQTSPCRVLIAQELCSKCKPYRVSEPASQARA